MPALPYRFLSLTLVILILAAVGAVRSFSAAAHETHGLAPLVHLPADQSAHPALHNEWWYVVGHLRSGGHTFGYEVTVFRFSNIRPPGFTVPISLYRTDVAITDETRGRFLQRVTTYFPQSARVSSHTLSVHVGTASLAGAGPKNMALQASLPGGSISLHLRSIRPAMNVGGRGYLRMGNGFTYYYSLTDIATSGSLQVGGTRYAVTGTSWLDHQWGNWSWSSIRGWTWMALQLSNGIQLSLFDFRSTSPPVRAASVLLRNGQLKTLQPISITSTGRWRSPSTRRVYPSGWIVRIPALQAQFRIVPAVKDQELTVPGAGPRAAYWEGSGRLTGTVSGKPVTGLTYTELTGGIPG